MGPQRSDGGGHQQRLRLAGCGGQAQHRHQQEQRRRERVRRSARPTLHPGQPHQGGGGPHRSRSPPRRHGGGGHRHRPQLQQPAPAGAVTLHLDVGDNRQARRQHGQRRPGLRGGEEQGEGVGHHQPRQTHGEDGPRQREPGAEAGHRQRRHHRPGDHGHLGGGGTPLERQAHHARRHPQHRRHQEAQRRRWIAVGDGGIAAGQDQGQHRQRHQQRPLLQIGREAGPIDEGGKEHHWGHGAPEELQRRRHEGGAPAVQERRRAEQHDGDHRLRHRAPGGAHPAEGEDHEAEGAHEDEQHPQVGEAVHRHVGDQRVPAAPQRFDQRTGWRHRGCRRGGTGRGHLYRGRHRRGGPILQGPLHRRLRSHRGHWWGCRLRRWSWRLRHGWARRGTAARRQRLPQPQVGRLVQVSQPALLVEEAHGVAHMRLLFRP